MIAEPTLAERLEVAERRIDELAGMLADVLEVSLQRRRECAETMVSAERPALRIVR